MTKKTAPAAAPARRASLLAPPPEHEPGFGAGTAAAIYFGLALLYFLPAFLPGKQIYGTDFSNAGYFFQDFLSRSFAAGHLPRWVPYLMGGVPLFSNPGSTYYPVRFVADWVLPVKGILPAIFLFQFFVAGWGMWLLARETGCRRWVAFVAGLCFQWTGILTSWVYAGHDGRIIVASFIPLLFYFLHNGVRTGRLAPFAGAAAAIGFALLSFQIQVAWYMLVGAAAWAVFCIVHLDTFRDRPRLLKVLAMGIGAVAFGFAMAAVNFLPFNGYVSHSPRAGSEGRGYDYSVSYSMPPANLAAMAVPEAVGASVGDPTDGHPVFPAYRGANGFKLHSEYVGAGVLVLFALGFYYARRSRAWQFFAGSGLFFLTMALGGNTPLYRLYWAVLPGLKKFRAPDLAYCMVAFSFVAMAALTLEAIARAREAAADRKSSTEAREKPEYVLWIGGAMIALVMLGAAAAGSGGGGAPGEPSAAGGWLRFLFFGAAATVALWMWASRRLPSTAAMWILALVVTLDLWSLGRKFFYTIPGPGEIYAADEVVGFLQTQPGPYRIFPLPGGWPGYPLGRDYPMLFSIDQAGGEHGNQLRRYNEFVGPGQGIEPDYHNFADPRFLAADNVRFIVSPQLLNMEGLREAFRGQSAVVYENTQAMPRAWIVGEAIRAGEAQTIAALQSPRWDPRRNAVVESPRDLALAGPALRGAAQVTRYTADRVEVTAQSDGAGLLVLADNWYPDWKATVDGRATEIYRTNHTFRGVVVPAGTHRVVFTFDPPSLRTGFMIYLATFGMLAAYGAWLLVAHFRRRGVETPDAPPEPAPAG
ncbi:MAG TPA: YfhO family protein [Longimicrobium sp.]